MREKDRERIRRKLRNSHTHKVTSIFLVKGQKAAKNQNANEETDEIEKRIEIYRFIRK